MPNVKVVPSVGEVPDGGKKLIVGYGNVKKLYGEVDILNHKIDETTEWTFSKTEKRDYFERDVMEFQKTLYEQIFEGSEYVFINLFSLKTTQLKHLVGVAKSESTNYYFINGDMMYMCQGTGKKVFGVSLSMARYGGIEPSKLVKLVTSNRNNVVKFKIGDVIDGGGNIRCENRDVPLLIRFFHVKNNEK